MKIIRTTSPKFTIINNGGKYKLLKVIGTYEGTEEGEKDAYKDMFDIMNNRVDENEIIKKRG